MLFVDETCSVLRLRINAMARSGVQYNWRGRDFCSAHIQIRHIIIRVSASRNMKKKKQIVDSLRIKLSEIPRDVIKSVDKIYKIPTKSYNKISFRVHTCNTIIQILTLFLDSNRTKIIATLAK